MKQPPPKPSPAPPVSGKLHSGHPQVTLPPKDVVLAAFTPRELDTLRTVCRDADNELGLRALNAGLARGGK